MNEVYTRRIWHIIIFFGDFSPGAAQFRIIRGGKEPGPEHADGEDARVAPEAGRVRDGGARAHCRVGAAAVKIVLFSCGSFYICACSFYLFILLHRCQVRAAVSFLVI